MRSPCRMLLFLLATFALPLQAQTWYAVQGRHAVAYSEGNSHAAREAVRRADLTLALVAETLHSKEIVLSAPLVLLAGPLTAAAPVRTPLGVYFTVNPDRPDSMAQLTRDISALALETNYPRAQSWFDAGLILYMEGTRFTAERAELGVPPPEVEAFLGAQGAPQAAGWIPFVRLMSLRDTTELAADERRAFSAESWALLRWLVANNRLAQAGEYFEAVEWRGLSAQEASRAAFSLDLEELEKAVRESLSTMTATTRATSSTASLFYRERKLPAPEVSLLSLIPQVFAAAPAEGQEAALQPLLALMREHQESAAVHRALAWAFLQRNDLDNAMEHVRHALAIEDTSPDMHYLYALITNQGDAAQIHHGSAVPRLSTELKDALRRDPSYAPAFELLGLAQLNDGELRPAFQSLQRASELRPRDGRYSLNLARAYAANGNVEAAQNLLRYLRSAGDAELAEEAGRAAEEISAPKKNTRMFGSVPIPKVAPSGGSRYDNLQEAIAADEAEEKSSPAAARDTRRTEHLRGTLTRVVCTGEAATLEVNIHGETWRVHTPDRNRAALIGASAIDCTWRSIRVAVNLKLSGERAGDLVSLELTTGK